MIEFIILIALIIFLPRKTKKQRIIYSIVICFGMCLLVGLRNANIGQYDTIRGYIPEFHRVKFMTYETIFKQFKDPIYYCLVKLFHYISDNEYTYLFVFGIPYNVAISYFIYKYSKSMSLSYLAVMGLSIWKYSFTGMRHVLAATFLIFALDAIIENKNKKYIIFTLVASCFHSSALIFLIIYPLSKIKANKPLLILTIIIGILSFFFRDIILSSMQVVFTKLNLSRYYMYSEWQTKGNGQGLLLYSSIFIFLWLIYGNVAKKFELKNYVNKIKLKDGSVSYRFLNSIYFITILFNALGLSVNEFIRLATYFGIILIIAIPQYIDLEKSIKYKNMIKVAFGTIFVLLFLFVVAPRSNIIPYYFNWEPYNNIIYN